MTFIDYKNFDSPGSYGITKHRSCSKWTFGIATNTNQLLTGFAPWIMAQTLYNDGKAIGPFSGISSNSWARVHAFGQNTMRSMSNITNSWTAHIQFDVLQGNTAFTHYLIQDDGDLTVIASQMGMPKKIYFLFIDKMLSPEKRKCICEETADVDIRHLFKP